jgi:hypothetical protein
MDANADEKQRLANKFRVALGLQQFGIAMMRQNFIRRNPDESSAEINARLRTWLRRPPAVGHGDLTERRPSRRDERV